LSSDHVVHILLNIIVVKLREKFCDKCWNVVAALGLWLLSFHCAIAHLVTHELTLQLL